MSTNRQPRYAEPKRKQEEAQYSSENQRQVKDKPQQKAHSTEQEKKRKETQRPADQSSRGIFGRLFRRRAPRDIHDKSRLTIALGVMMDFVRVPAGEFLMGAADTDWTAGAKDKPQHKVYLDEYYIGVAPVTVAQFVAFVQASGYAYPAGLDVKNKSITRTAWTWRRCGLLRLGNSIHWQGDTTTDRG